MLQYFETLTDDSGNSLLGATCTVTNYSSGTLAAIYNTNGTASPVANSTVVADITGQISFYAPDGAYTLTYSYKSTVYKTKSPVQMLDPMEFATATDTGAANAYVVTSAAYPAALYAGLKLTFVAANANTGASTLNLNATGAQPLVQVGGAALGSGMIAANGIYQAQWSGTQWQVISDLLVTAGSIGPLIYPRTQVEINAGIVPANTSFPTGTFYRYGAKGAAARISDGVANGAIITSASGGFAGAVAGMVAVVVDGGATRSGGRPVPLITTILSVQSANQITLNTAVIQPPAVTINGTLSGTAAVTALSASPIASGIFLTRNWAVTGTNIAANTTIAATSATTMTLSIAATGSGASALTMRASFEVCFGFDDSAAIAQALSLPYKITDATDNFLSTLPLSVGQTGCNNISMPSTLLIFAINNNNTACLTAAGLDRTNNVNFLVGLRYLPFHVEFGELECCNTGLGGISLQPAYFSTLKARVTNPFRSALEEFFLSPANDGAFSEGNVVEINCGRVGLHFHHKVNKANGVYQTLSGYRILGRSPGLNSGFLGINVATQPDQCGGGIRLYTAGAGTAADGGMGQNVWGAQAFCELDGERSCALSFGSDICNSPVTFVDASANYVIEGNASANFSNTYRSNVFSNMVIEDISQGADARGGYQYYAMANTVTQSSTVLSSSAGPWGQTYASPLMLSNADQLVRWPQRLSYPGLLITNDAQTGGAQFPVGYLGLPVNSESTNYVFKASDVSKVIVNSAGTQTLNSGIFNPGNTLDVIAFGGALLIVQGASVTLNWYNGTTIVTGNRTLANGARATIVCVPGSNQFVITAPGGLT